MSRWWDCRWRIAWQFLGKLTFNFPHTLAIPLLGICPRETETHVCRKTCTHVFTAVLFSFKLFIFNWRTTALQCRAGLCQASAWPSHRCTHTLALWKLPPTSRSSGSSQSFGFKLPVSHSKVPRAAQVSTWRCIYFNAALSVLPTLSFPYCVHKPFLYVCVFTA